MSQYHYNIQLLSVIYSIDYYSSLEEDGNIISHLILLCLQYNGNKVKDDELIWINRGGSNNNKRGDSIGAFFISPIASWEIEKHLENTK